jgi:hypothetical protein
MTGREADNRILDLLAENGSDLTKPAHTIHYLYFPSIEAARAAGGELRAAGYGPVHVHKAPMPLVKRLFSKPSFACIAETRAVPELNAVHETSNKMHALAAKHGGEYDGWEASVERD